MEIDKRIFNEGVKEGFRQAQVRAQELIRQWSRAKICTGALKDGLARMEPELEREGSNG